MTRTVISPSKCHGCGTDIPPSNGGRARKWCSERCRKQTLYSGECIDCGARTNGYNGRATAGERCIDCRSRWQHEQARWTPEAIVLALQADAARRGRTPKAWEWKTHTHETPTLSTVQSVMGSWNAAIEAAGLDVRRTGHYGRPGEDPAVVQETIELYRSGLSIAAVGKAQGLCAETIRYRLKKFGEPTRDTASYAVERRTRIAELWRAGVSPAEIAADVGARSGPSIVGTVSLLRSLGWDLPYRRRVPVERRRAVASVPSTREDRP